MKRSRFAFSLCASLAVLPFSASAQVNYSEGFQGAVGAEWSSSLIIDAQVSVNRRALGDFGNDTVTLTLSGFTPGVSASLAFDLYILNSWDGESFGTGPDGFTAQIDGSNVVNATFTNLDEQSGHQSYSATTPLGGAFVPAYTDADEIDTLDASYYGNSVYKFGGGHNPGFSFVPSTSTVVFSFAGSNLQGLADESWAIDNVSVIQSIPEPSTWAALGLGAIVAIRRRRR